MDDGKLNNYSASELNFAMHTVVGIKTTVGIITAHDKNDSAEWLKKIE